MISRRNLLAASAVGAAMTVSAAKAATFGNPDEPPQGAINAKGPGNLADPGPQSQALGSQFPSAQTPPATDVGGMPTTWASFNNAPKRIQNGGWARQVTVDDFAISKEIAGVNMRLTAGGIRELHWHQAAEWAIMTYGTCRVTVLDAQGRPYVADVKEGDLWYFPPGAPHSLQGLGRDGCEFVICFDDGHADEFNTLLVTDWFAHTPPEVLAKNFGVPAETFAKIPLHNLWIFQGTVPGDLVADRAAIQKDAPVATHPFIFPLGSSRPVKSSDTGYLQVADSTNFKVSAGVAAALVTVRPGGIREMHWHPNADEWQYYIKGKARMTVFDTGPNALTTDFNAGDIGYVKRNLGHYVENVGDTDMQFVAVFRASRYEEVSLSNWLTHTPPALVAQHLNVDEATIAKWPDTGPGIMPKS
ncbi:MULTISPECIES: cupin domain-containing protein [unclassified Bradyrhizobium]|uniref:cupin domain-containing protein n=1 Tax=unclassified Bradyrhizobium TaxID=2631580 RepID=UPI00055D29A0|nr:MULTISPECIES: cupin domain-containing protein [unclassified Bradyrhizobium]QIG98236.1 cupin domain-containing protein [Bradyrhizobium sp. 6(2017)]